ncbi:NADH-quinone oxidoreductase subunit L [Seongchinamella sediminis]|uniref:Probable inorganic carbon transporter subunit DabB n=1 Tax=Seongchinamella sediminis TaxID=2283635 RepID=A0A3L7DUJ7_9GAMM|nr:NADH-quinone oxidoreductase subunit L [Seongchinamella sediminis]RLQ21054.1 NADH-quinone oxidoreductase subunit L [Seongchinamella sediminis]
MTALVGGWATALFYTLALALVWILPQRQWSIAKAAAALGLLAAGAAIAGALAGLPVAPGGADALGLTGILLVALLGWVIVNYSCRYLDGEPHQGRFVRAMLFTLASVSVLMVSRHLVIIVLAWSGTSIGLHFLLTHYQERKTAQIVAHKKFLVSRLAELCLVIALVLVYQATGTLALDGLYDHLGGLSTLPAGLAWAASLFALAAILKCAQLPLHGWLIQVMEAPTPVSALLHAGVVNIGGFVLIRLAALVSLAPTAQALLVIAGSVTALLASLVMMTRISIKVRLAWSTCAQMGFMLVEVGLGLYELALLHLVAHSLYKAHAFLAAGTAVEQAHANDFLAGRGALRPGLWYLAAAGLSAALVTASVLAWQALVPSLSLPPVALAIVALGLAPLLWLEQGGRPWQIARSCAALLGLTQLYLLWHLLFAGLAPPAGPVATYLIAWTLLCFGALYGIQAWLRRHPGGRLARAIYPWAYCGFYLDETFTRLTFRIWPARLSPVQAGTLVNRHFIVQGDKL